VRSENDPDNFIRQIPRNVDDDVLVLGLDLGTKCGCAFAYLNPDKPVDASTINMHMSLWNLSAGPYDSGAIRFARLRRFLHVLQPSLIGYEQPKYTPPKDAHQITAQAIIGRAATSLEFFGALQATVATWAEERAVPCEGFPIGTIKKLATGKGNAGKPAMVTACNALFGTDFDVESCQQMGTDNVADAAFVCLLVAQNYTNGLARCKKD
jgi:hypothetical protein